MTRYAICTDLNRCIGCLACTAACKVVNEVPIGNYWTRILRIGPTPKYEGAQVPDVQMYYLPMGCQHCDNPECVNVCPTGASMKTEDGTVQIDKEQCIGCESCIMACPYGVRYLNEDSNVVEKCTLCEEKIAQGELPQCVAQCGGRARFFGDLDEGLDSFVGPGTHEVIGEEDKSYEAVHSARVMLGEYVNAFSDDEVYHLTDVGNGPAFCYILRDKTWIGEA